MISTMLRAMAVLGVMTLVACDEEAVDPGPDPIRAIKHAKLDQRAGLQVRKIAGLVAAAQTANVAFETGGQVVELLRKSGDRVEAGELIGRLDAEPYKLRVDQARASLEQAQAQADDARKKFEQQSELFRQGYATRTAYDSAEAANKNAQGAVDVAVSQLDLAERDMAKTDLKAPFAGVISVRQVEQFEDVTGGQPVYSMQTTDTAKVEASLPETLINIVSLGSSVEITFPPLGDATVAGTLDEIAPQTGDANAYPIKIALTNAPPGLRSGMSAELTFRFETETTGKAFLVPLAAVLPVLGAESAAKIFVYDPSSNTLNSRDVTIANVEGNSLEVIGQLEEGEIYATAGVSFLHDGMKVDLFDASSLQ